MKKNSVPETFSNKQVINLASYLLLTNKDYDKILILQKFLKYLYFITAIFLYNVIIY